MALMSDRTIEILGTKYKVLYRKPATYPDLESDEGGICDGTKKIIVINEDTMKDDAECARSNLRHEVIHAYLFESGLSFNWLHPQMGHDETYVD